MKKKSILVSAITAGVIAVSGLTSCENVGDGEDVNKNSTEETSDDKAADAKCGEGKCGDDMDADADSTKSGDMKCGEGKCGDDMDAEDADSTSEE